MLFLGMLAMGVFVGLLATQGTQFIDSTQSWKSTLAAILGSCFGGVVVTYINSAIQAARNAPTISMYLVGLLLGYTWFQTPKLAAMITGSSGPNFWLGVLGMGGNIVLSIVAFVFVVPFAWKDIKEARK